MNCIIPFLLLFLRCKSSSSLSEAATSNFYCWGRRLWRQCIRWQQLRGGWLRWRHDAAEDPGRAAHQHQEQAECQLIIQTYKREQDEDDNNQDDLCGSSEYLFEYSRIDNIITDVYYHPFTSAMHEVAKDFKLSVNEPGHFVKGSEDNVWGHRCR